MGEANRKRERNVAVGPVAGCNCSDNDSRTACGGIEDWGAQINAVKSGGWRTATPSILWEHYGEGDWIVHGVYCAGCCHHNNTIILNTDALVFDGYSDRNGGVLNALRMYIGVLPDLSLNSSALRALAMAVVEGVALEALDMTRKQEPLGSKTMSSGFGNRFSYNFEGLLLDFPKSKHWRNALDYISLKQKGAAA